VKGPLIAALSALLVGALVVAAQTSPVATPLPTWTIGSVPHSLGLPGAGGQRPKSSRSEVGPRVELHDRSASVGRAPARLVFSLQRRRGEFSPVHVYVIDADGSGRKALTRGPEQDAEVAASPDGRWVAFERSYRKTSAGSVHVIRPNGRGGRRLGLTNPDLLVPRPWAANSSRFLVSTWKAVFAVDPVSGKWTKLRVPRSYVWGGYSIAWSPDRRRLSFTHQLVGRPGAAIEVVELASGRTRRVASGSVDGAIWLRDGKRIVYARIGVEAGGLWIVNASGRGSRRFAAAQLAGSYIERSPNDRIAFVTHRPGQVGGVQIEAVNVDGTMRQVLVSGGPDCCLMSTWSPDGRKIAFLRRQRIWVINADGSGERQLTSSGYANSLSWLRSTR